MSGTILANTEGGTGKERRNLWRRGRPTPFLFVGCLCVCLTAVVRGELENMVFVRNVEGGVADTTRQLGRLSDGLSATTDLLGQRSLFGRQQTNSHSVSNSSSSSSSSSSSESSTSSRSNADDMNFRNDNTKRSSGLSTYFDALLPTTQEIGANALQPQRSTFELGRTQDARGFSPFRQSDVIDGTILGLPQKRISLAKAAPQHKENVVAGEFARDVLQEGIEGRATGGRLQQYSDTSSAVHLSSERRNEVQTNSHSIRRESTTSYPPAEDEPSSNARQAVPATAGGVAAVLNRVRSAGVEIPSASLFAPKPAGYAVNAVALTDNPILPTGGRFGLRNIASAGYATRESASLAAAPLVRIGTALPADSQTDRGVFAVLPDIMGGLGAPDLSGGAITRRGQAGVASALGFRLTDTPTAEVSALELIQPLVGGGTAANVGPNGVPTHAYYPHLEPRVNPTHLLR